MLNNSVHIANFRFDDVALRYQDIVKTVAVAVQFFFDCVETVLKITYVGICRFLF